MAEVTGKDGTWTFDGEMLRIVPGGGRRVHRLRRLLGELWVPLTAVAAITYEPNGKRGALRVQLRQGADPVLQAAGGTLTGPANPYRLGVDKGRSAVAERLVGEIRNCLKIQEVGTDPVDRYLLPGPDVPIRASCSDGSAAFDGESVRLEWKWSAHSAKEQGGPRRLALREIAGVELRPSAVLDDGYLRFQVKEQAEPPEPGHDPNCLKLHGFTKETVGAVALASAVLARLPHPNAQGEPSTAHEPQPDIPEHDHDTMLRRLRELGDLHKEGVLTEEEFATAKQALLRRF